MASYYLLVALFWTLPAFAIPVSASAATAASGPSPVALTVGLCTPFVILVVVKYTYMKYRRAEFIHSDTIEMHAQTKAPSRLIELGLDSQILQKPSRKFKIRCLSGYMVGFLGSPEWETTMKVRVDRVLRKSRITSLEGALGSTSSSLASCHGINGSHATSIGGKRSRHNSSRQSSSRSRTMSLNFLELYSPDATSASGHVSSSGGSEILLVPPLPAETLRYVTGNSKPRRHTSTASFPTSVLLVSEPVTPSVQHERLDVDINNHSVTQSLSKSIHFSGR